MPAKSESKIESEFVRTSAVQNFFGGVSKMWINRRVHSDPDFPRPVYFGTAVPFWRLSDLRAYADARAAASKATA